MLQCPQASSAAAPFSPFLPNLFKENYNDNPIQDPRVTLVEIAIVLVIIGLLLGGVLKGQELINNAKVRSMADRQNSLKVAWFSFIDRYGAIPGDYVRALANVPGAQKSGNGDGLIAQAGEGPNVLQNLTGAGYLRCPQCTGSKTAETFSGNNSLVNQYGGVMGLYHGSQNYATIGGSSARLRLLVYTGQGIPSNIIAEVDRKIDDGVSNTGDVVFSSWTASGNNPPEVGECVAQDANPVLAAKAKGGSLNATVPQAWRGALAQPPIEQSCGGAVSI